MESFTMSLEEQHKAFSSARILLQTEMASLMKVKEKVMKALINQSQLRTQEPEA